MRKPVIHQPNRIISRNVNFKNAWDDYNSALDTHDIREAPNPNNKRTVLAQWEKKIVKKERHPARKEKPSIKEKPGS